MPASSSPNSLFAAAERVEAGTLAALLLLPALAGLALGTSLVLTLPAATGGLGWGAFTLGLVKLCYLGTGAAQFGRWLVESGPLRPFLATEPADGGDLASVPAGALFPGALDGCLLSLALATLVQALLR